MNGYPWWISVPVAFVVVTLSVLALILSGVVWVLIACAIGEAMRDFAAWMGKRNRTSEGGKP